jgi:hypothetical protein
VFTNTFLKLETQLKNISAYFFKLRVASGVNFICNHYFGYFRQKIWRFSLKINVFINFWHKLCIYLHTYIAVLCAKNGNFFDKLFFEHDNSFLAMPQAFKRVRYVPANDATTVSTNEQGCQIFLGTTYQNGKKHTQWPQNGHKIYHLTVK